MHNLLKKKMKRKNINHKLPINCWKKYLTKIQIWCVGGTVLSVYPGFCALVDI